MAELERTPRFSETTMTEIVLPQHANAVGTAFGGTVVSWIDICAAVAAQRHCGTVAVTASIDEVVFRAPMRVGDVVQLRSRVNATFRTSLEVECYVEIENTKTRERTLCVDALLTFVNIDERGRPCEVPPLMIETDEDTKRVEAAMTRRVARLSARKAKNS